MIGQLTRPQGEALVALLRTLRHDWDLPGIRAAVQRAVTLGPAADVCVAACRVAGNREALTPGLIPMPGNHWQGTTVAARQLPMFCADHVGQPAGTCTECVKEAKPVDHAAGVQRVKAALQESRR